MSFAHISKQALMRASTHWLKMAKADKARADTEKRFWSIAAEVEVSPRTWKTEIAQVYATDAPSALAAYFISQPKRVNIVGVAPTLGFWVNDRDGKELSTT